MRNGVEFLRAISELRKADGGAGKLAEALEEALFQLWAIETDMRHPSVDRHVSNVLESIEGCLFGDEDIDRCNAPAPWHPLTHLMRPPRHDQSAHDE